MKKLLADIEAGRISPVYVLYGDEPAPIHGVVAALRQAVLAPGLESLNHERFEGRTLDHIGRVLEACAQLPVMGSHRLVELADPEQVARSRSGATDATKAAIAAIAAYAAAPNPTTVLVVTSIGIDGRSRIVTGAKKNGVVHKFEQIKRDSDAIGFVLERASIEGIGIDRDAAAAIVAAVGTSQSDLMAALERASLHADAGGTVSVTDVEAVVSHTREAVIFELTDAVGSGDRERALEVLARIFDERSMPEIGQANVVLAMLIRQIRLVFVARFATGRIEQAAGVPPFVARKLESQARRLDERRLRRAYAGLARLDRELKGESAVATRSPRMALERWIFDVCGGVPGAPARL